MGSAALRRFPWKGGGTRKQELPTINDTNVAVGILDRTRWIKLIANEHVYWPCRFALLMNDRHLGIKGEQAKTTARERLSGYEIASFNVIHATVSHSGNVILCICFVFCSILLAFEKETEYSKAATSWRVWQLLSFCCQDRSPCKQPAFFLFEIFHPPEPVCATLLIKIKEKISSELCPLLPKKKSFWSPAIIFSY